jgi:hypothetical protein
MIGHEIVEEFVPDGHTPPLKSNSSIPRSGIGSNMAIVNTTGSPSRTTLRKHIQLPYCEVSPSHRKNKPHYFLLTNQLNVTLTNDKECSFNK